MIISCSVLLRMKNISNFVAKIIPHILCPITFFSFKNRVVYEIMWNNAVAGQATDDNMAYARYMLDT